MDIIRSYKRESLKLFVRVVNATRTMQFLALFLSLFYRGLAAQNEEDWKTAQLLHLIGQSIIVSHQYVRDIGKRRLNKKEQSR